MSRSYACRVSRIARLLATNVATASECGGYWRLESRKSRQRDIAKVKNRKNENRENSAKNGEICQLFEN